MAKTLARRFQTTWVPEYARYYIDQLNRPYQFEDIEIMAKGQKKWEEQKAEEARDLLFCDTDFIVTKIWSEFVFKKCSPWIQHQVETHVYDLYLLMDIDLPWSDDPQREHPHKRTELFEIYKQELVDNNFAFRIVSGIGEARVHNAVDALSQFIDI